MLNESKYSKALKELRCVYILFGCLYICLLTLRMLCVLSPNSCFHHSLLTLNILPLASQIIPLKMPQNTAKIVLHILASLFRFVFSLWCVFRILYSFCRWRWTKSPKKTKRRNRKVHISFSPFLSILPVSDVVRKRLSRVVSQPLTTPYTLSNTRLS